MVDVGSEKVVDFGLEVLDEVIEGFDGLEDFLHVFLDRGKGTLYSTKSMSGIVRKDYRSYPINLFLSYIYVY